MSDFWCSGTVRKCLENGKNRKEIKWLLIALGSTELICSWRFLKNFFFKMSVIKFSFTTLNCSFSTFRAWHQKWAQSQKSGSWNKQKKNDTKAVITRDCHQLRPRFFDQKLHHIQGLSKSCANLTSDLLIFDLWVHICQKRNTAKSNCIFNSKLRPEGLRFLDIWIARWINIFLESTYILFQFWTSSWDKLGQKLDQKNNLWERPAVVKIWLF